MTALRTAATLALVVAAAAGCRERGDRSASSDTLPAPRSSATSTDSMEIFTRDGAVVLALVHDSVQMRLSQKTLASTQKDLDTAKLENSSGFGAGIERFVKHTVSTALRTTISYPVRDIEDARYEDGRIVFRLEHRHGLSFDAVHTDDRPALSDFPPEDAKRFVAAVNAARQ